MIRLDLDSNIACVKYTHFAERSGDIPKRFSSFKSKTLQVATNRGIIRQRSTDFDTNSVVGSQKQISLAKKHTQLDAKGI